MESKPFNHKEIVDLRSLGLEPNYFRFGILTFESDKYIAIKDKSSADTDDSDNAIVIELQNNFRLNRIRSKGDACLMHPEQNIMVLRAEASDNKFVIQVYNIEVKSKMKALDVSEPILFWKWLNSNKLGFVTNTAVYYTDIYNNNEDKIKLFDRTPQESSQIIGLSLDPTEKWGLLTTIGLFSGGPILEGVMQLYSCEMAASQRLESHCGCFGEVYLHNSDEKSTVIAFVQKRPLEKTSTIFIIELGNPPALKQKFKGTCQLDLPSENDFPVFMHIASKYGLLYIWTKSGYYFIVEILSSSIIGTGKLVDDIVFVGCKNSKTDGVYVITKQGKLISLDDETKIANYIQSPYPHNPDKNHDENPLLKSIRNIIQVDPDAALSIAKDAIKKGVSVNQIVEIFLSNKREQDITSLLDENLKDNQFEKESKVEPQKTEDGKNCMVCLVQPAQTAFIPCGHKRTCADCSAVILHENKTCPVCHVTVQSHLRIHD